MILKEVVQSWSERLRELEIESARLDVELLVSNYFKFDRAGLMLQEKRIVSEEEYKEINKFLERRASGEPVAYILGEKDFYKDTFIVRPGILVPRPETELVVEEALAWIKDKNIPKVVDLGCGSGCIGLSIVKEYPQINLEVVDISPIAIEVSKLNAKRLGIEKQCTFIQADVLRLNLEPTNIIVANPPYLDESDPTIDKKSLKFEPNQALYSKEKGFYDIKAWLKKSAELLLPSGLLLMEIGYKQGNLVREFLSSVGLFKEVQILKDYSQRERVIRAIKW